ncbi:MAG: hypothetical protein AVO35_06270 [Candidatus Aegiribacteria sp. MLS_C]|nr:MAG: hypothetical protein AVO35_06270 [Candidatus Aegiribacteria sp. MLS_C]
MKHVCSVLVLVFVLYAMPEGVDPEPRGTQLFPCAMTRYSTPIKVSGVLGVSFNRITGHGGYRGFFAQLEPGFGGGKVNLGYRFGRMQFMPLWNIGLSASALQTWGNPLDDVEPDQTYLGLELSGAFSMLGLNFGVFRHLAGDDGEHDWILTLGAGAGI